MFRFLSLRFTYFTYLDPIFFFYFPLFVTYTGGVQDWSEFTSKAHAHGALVVGCTDLMASVLLKPVGEMGFDIAVGSAQRFGVPMGFGGPHAGFLATTTA